MSKSEFIRLDTEKFSKINPLDVEYMAESEKQVAIENAITNTYKIIELHTGFTLVQQEKDAISQFINQNADINEKLQNGKLQIKDLYEELLSKDNNELSRLIQILKELI